MSSSSSWHETFDALPHPSLTEPISTRQHPNPGETRTQAGQAREKSTLAWSHITFMTKASSGHSVGPEIQLHSPSKSAFLLSKMMILYCSILRQPERPLNCSSNNLICNFVRNLKQLHLRNSKSTFIFTHIFSAPLAWVCPCFYLQPISSLVHYIPSLLSITTFSPHHQYFPLMNHSLQLTNTSIFKEEKKNYL